MVSYLMYLLGLLVCSKTRVSLGIPRRGVGVMYYLSLCIDRADLSRLKWLERIPEYGASSSFVLTLWRCSIDQRSKQPGLCLVRNTSA